LLQGIATFLVHFLVFPFLLYGAGRNHSTLKKCLKVSGCFSVRFCVVLFCFPTFLQIMLPVPHRIFIVPDGLHGFFQYPYNNTNAAGLQPLPPGWENFPL
jgi:hypothetical protein